MSKIIVIVLSVLLLITIAGLIYFPMFYGERKVAYPKYVYNSCTNKWAIQTGKGDSNDPDVILYFGAEPFEDYGKKSGFFYGFRFSEDDSLHSRIGKETQFNSKKEAVAAYHSFYLRNIRPIEIEDSLNRIEHKRKDSLFKCQHTYQ